MRAAVLLLCLALVRDHSASIFRHQYRPQLDSFIVEPLNYISQYQQEIQQIGAHSQKSSSSSSSQSSESKEYAYSSNNNPSSEQANYNQNWNTPYYSNAVRQSGPMPRNVITWQAAQSASPYLPQPETENVEYIFDEAYKTMQHVSEETKKKIHEAFSANHKNNEDSERNATQLLQKNNYDVEEHVAKTEDGYNLTLFRIQPRQHRASGEKTDRPVALLVHGLLGSADDWLLMGPGKSLAYQMAEAGFDVWLGNVRGSKYSQHHASKHPGQSDFWQFSIDEVAQHDLPAMIDHALKVSQQRSLYYIGHNQGTTAFFAMASTRPEYREKVAMMHALSPMVYMTNVRSPLFRMVSPKSRYYKPVHDQLGHGQFKPNKDFVQRLGGKMCENLIGCEHICSNVNFVISGVDTTGMDMNLMPAITRHLPAGASTRQIKQYGQAKAAEQFRKYDFGSEINAKVYGQRQPPKYNMSDVQVPVALYYSEEDLLAHPVDVERLYRELPDVRDYYKVPEKHFSNMDFQFSKKTPTVINQRVIESISKIHNGQHKRSVKL